MKWLTVPSENAALQELRGLRNRRMLGSAIPDCMAGLAAQELRMARYWLALLDDVLTWLNPILGCAAAMLVVLVIQAADEYFSRNRMSAAVAASLPEKAAPAVECAHATLPREWRELRFYD